MKRNNHFGDFLETYVERIDLEYTHQFVGHTFHPLLALEPYLHTFSFDHRETKYAGKPIILRRPGNQYAKNRLGIHLSVHRSH